MIPILPPTFSMQVCIPERIPDCEQPWRDMEGLWTSFPLLPLVVDALLLRTKSTVPQSVEVVIAWTDDNTSAGKAHSYLSHL